MSTSAPAPGSEPAPPTPPPSAVPPPPPGPAAQAEATPAAVAVLDGPLEVEIQAYADGPPTRVDISKAAPFGWWPAVIIALAAFIDRAESAVTLGAAASLQEEFGFNDAFLGVLASAPIVASLLLVIPAGRLADRVKRKNMLVVVMCMWGVFTIGAGAAVSLAMFLTFRVLLGAAAPLNIPPSSSMLGDFYPRRSRTKAFGLFRGLENTGLPVGTLVGAVVGGLVGWRAAFFVLAVPALILAALLYFTLREPRRGVGDEISAMTDGTAPIPGGAVIAPPMIDLPSAATTPPATAVPPASGPPSRVTGPQSASVVAASGEPHAGVSAEHHEGIVGQTLEEFGQPEYGPMSLDVPPPTGPQRLGVWATFRAVFRIATVRRLVIGQTVLFAAFAGFFAFGTLFFAREYFQVDTVFSTAGRSIVTGEAQAAAGLLIAGLSLVAIPTAAVIAAKIDDRFAVSRPTLRVNASVLALITGFLALLTFVVTDVFAVRVVAFLIFAGVNIVAVSNLSAAIADTLPARMRGQGFSAFQFLLAFGSAFGAALVGIGSSLFGDELRFGFATLLLPLLIGVIVVARARSSYVSDADAVVAEAGGRVSGGVAPAM